MYTSFARSTRVLCSLVISVLCICSCADSLAQVVPGGQVEDPSPIEFKGFPIAAYTPETSLTFAGFGLALIRPKSGEPHARASSVLAAGAYTLNDQWMLNLSPNLYLDGGTYNVQSSLSLLRWPNSFFGVGAGAESGTEERFDATALQMITKVRRRVFDPRLYVGVEYEFATRAIDALEDGLISTDLVAGSDGGLLSAVGLNFAWDSRDNSFAATQGTYLQGSIRTFTPLLGSDYAYVRYRLDARHYLPLGHDQVLAVQGAWESHVGDVPFYKLAKLGGQKRLRGLYKGKYRDKDMLLFQAEYRTPPLWRLRLAGFGGIGEVYSDENPFSVDRLKWSAGLGLRVAVDEAEGVNVRADLGVSPEGTGFYLSIGEAF